MARLRARFKVATEEEVEDILMEYGVLRDLEPRGLGLCEQMLHGLRTRRARIQAAGLKCSTRCVSVFYAPDGVKLMSPLNTLFAVLDGFSFVCAIAA